MIVFRTRHDPQSLVPAVDFVTATGNLDRMVTPLGIFRATPAGLRLEAIQADVTLEEVARRTGFGVNPLPDLAPIPPPTSAELDALRTLDPDRLRDLDFR